MKKFTILIFGWALAINCFIFPTLDLDTFHDGFIYPMALIDSNGGNPNKDYFSLYGPIVPSIHGLWLQLFGENVWRLRLHGATIISIISLLLYLVLRTKLDNSTSILICASWLVGNPLIVQPSLPWVDLYTTTILILGMLYIIKHKFHADKHFFLLGITFSLGIFIKINFVIPIFGIWLVIIFVYGIRSGVFFVTGVLITILTAIIIMLMTGSLIDYFKQGIVFPLNMYDEGKSLRGLINVKIILFGVAVMLLLIAWRRVPHSLKESRVFNLWLPMFLCAAAVFITLFFRKINEPFSALLGLNPVDAINNLLKNSPYALMYSAIFIIWLKGFSSIRNSTIFMNRDSKTLILGIAVCSTLQLYPNPEPGHIWYILPIVIAGIFYDNSFNQYKNLDEKLFTKLLLLPTCLSLVTINLIYVSQERINHTVEPLRQMKSAPQVVESVDLTLRKLSFFTSGKTVQFNCPLGIYSVAGNTYRGSDSQYVDIIPKYKIPKTDSDLIFECDLEKNQISRIERSRRVLFVSPGYGQYGENILYSSSE